MKDPLGEIKSKKTTKKKRALSTVLIVIGAILIVFSSYRLISGYLEYLSARNEYDELREIFSDVIIPPVLQLPPEQSEPEAQLPEQAAPQRPIPIRPREPEVLVDPMETLLEINPDFIGWIRIPGIIDYPVVQGRDNNRYLNTTFQGNRNSSGAIFLDYRNNSAFYDQVSIIYGHNMRDGSMFKPLHQLRNQEFLSEHEYITMVTADWRILMYRIFAVRIVDTWETENNPEQLTSATVARTIRNTPEDAERILILSTCTTSGNNAERLRVYAAKIDYVPAQG